MAIEPVNSTNQYVAHAFLLFAQAFAGMLEVSTEQLRAGDKVELTFELGQGNFDCTGKIIPQTLTTAGDYRITRTTQETLCEHNGVNHAITMAQADEYYNEFAE